VERQHTTPRRAIESIAGPGAVSAKNDRSHPLFEGRSAPVRPKAVRAESAQHASGSELDVGVPDRQLSIAWERRYAY
jgi:hypothetical protein